MKTIYWFSIADKRGWTDIEAATERAARQAFMRSNRALDWIEKHREEPEVNTATLAEVQAWSIGRMG